MKILLTTILIFSAIGLWAQNVQDNLKKHVYVLASDSLEGRGFGAEGGHKAALYIAEEFKKIGLEPIDEDYFHAFDHRQGFATVKGKNVVGILPGNNPQLKNEYIVMGGHYDHLGVKDPKDPSTIYNGADDNATGVSTVIELARYFAQNKSNSRTMVFIGFDGEESGLIGSKYFVKDSLLEPSKIKAMFSIDMVGKYDTYQGLDMKGIGMLEGGEIMLSNVAEKNDIQLKKNGGKTIGKN